MAQAGRLLAVYNEDGVPVHRPEAQARPECPPWWTGGGRTARPFSLLAAGIGGSALPGTGYGWTGFAGGGAEK